MADSKSFNSDCDEFQDSIVKGLLDRYEVNPSEYLASSRRLVEASKGKVDRETLNDMFKDKAKYYQQFVSVELPQPIRMMVVHITPRLARDMLDFSGRGKINKELSNRKISRSKIKKYIRDMDEEKWCLTGEPVIIGFDGEILDGHTRLTAASESKWGFIAIILWGISDLRAFAHTNTGTPRSRAQVLEMAGVSVHAKTLSRVATLSMAFELTPNPYAFRATQGTDFGSAEVLEYVQNNEELALSVDFVSKLVKKHRRQVQVPLPTLAFAHALIKSKMKTWDGDELPVTPESYLSNIISGLGQTSTDSVEYKVREFLQTMVGETSSYAVLCRLACIFKGWNMYVGISVVGNRVAVRRVGKFTRDEDGNRVRLKGSGNIKEAFTIPFMPRGKTPGKVQKRAALHEVK